MVFNMLTQHMCTDLSLLVMVYAYDSLLEIVPFDEPLVVKFFLGLKDHRTYKKTFDFNHIREALRLASRLACMRALRPLLELVIETLFKCGVRQLTDPLDEAAKEGQLSVLEWFMDYAKKEKRLELYFTSKAFEYAISRDDLHLLEWLHLRMDRIEQYPKPSAMYKTSNINTLKWMSRHFPGLEWCLGEAIDEAALMGDLQTVQWLHACYDGCACHYTSLRSAAISGNLPLVEWISKNCKIQDNGEASAWAAAYGQLHIANWFNGCIPRKPSVEVAAKIGNLEGINFLLKYAPEYLNDVIKVSAQEGHLHVLNHLIDPIFLRRSTNLISKIAIRAICGGQLSVLEWLSKLNPNAGCIMIGTTSKYVNRIPLLAEIIEWIKSKGYVSIQDDRLTAWDIVTHAASYMGSVDALRQVPFSADYARSACMGGQLKALQYFVSFAREHSIEIPDCLLDDALSYGHTSLASWLLSQPEFNHVTEECCVRAAAGGHLESLLMLESQLEESDCVKVLSEALKKDQLEVVQWCFPRLEPQKIKDVCQNLPAQLKLSNSTLSIDNHSLYWLTKLS